MRSSLVASWICSVLLAGLALSCSPPIGDVPVLTMAQKSHFAGTIVVGKILETYLDPDMHYGGDVYSATMKVYCVYKGDVSASLINITHVGIIPGLCHATKLEKGSEYVVYLDGQDHRISDVQIENTEPHRVNVSRACGLHLRYPDGVDKADLPHTCPEPASETECVPKYVHEEGTYPEPPAPASHDDHAHDHDSHDHESHDLEGHDHEDHGHEDHDHDQFDHEAHDHVGHTHEEHDEHDGEHKEEHGAHEEGHDHDGHDHDGHDHEDHDHDQFDHDSHDHEGHTHEEHDKHDQEHEHEHEADHDHEHDHEHDDHEHGGHDDKDHDHEDFDHEGHGHVGHTHEDHDKHDEHHEEEHSHEAKAGASQGSDSSRASCAIAVLLLSLGICASL